MRLSISTLVNTNDHLSVFLISLLSVAKLHPGRNNVGN